MLANSGIAVNKIEPVNQPECVWVELDWFGIKAQVRNLILCLISIEQQQPALCCMFYVLVDSSLSCLIKFMKTFNIGQLYNLVQLSIDKRNL